MQSYIYLSINIFNYEYQLKTNFQECIIDGSGLQKHATTLSQQKMEGFR
jgi:hypothetical protein